MISDFIHEKLLDWARWVNSGGGSASGYPGHEMESTAPEPDYRDPDSERMDLLICKLTRAQKKAVIARYYLHMSDREAGIKYHITHQAHSANVKLGAWNLEDMWHKGECPAN